MSNIYLRHLRYDWRMDMRRLRYFLTVVHEGSVSRAAARLSMTQPPLSAAIAELERELGVRLLERHSRGVDATVAGEYLARQATQVFAHIDEITAAVRGIGSGRLGRLAIATSPPIGWETLPTLLATFDGNSPDVDTEIVESTDSEVIDQVRDHRAEVGTVYCARIGHLAHLRGRELEVALIRREPLVVIVPSSSPFADTVAVDLPSLATQRWIVPTGDDGFPGLATLVRQAWQHAAIEPHARHTASSAYTIVRLVAAGLGVAMVPASVRAIAGDDVRVLALSQPLSPIEAAVVWRRHERPSPVLSRFLRAALATHEPDRLGPQVARDQQQDAPRHDW
jgi:DNA-binding transcriptional LysR family regulator